MTRLVDKFVVVRDVERGPIIKQPEELASISKFRDHTCYDRRNLKTYIAPSLPIDLNRGFERFRDRDRSNPYPAPLNTVITGLRHANRLHELSTADFVSWRCLLFCSGDLVLMNMDGGTGVGMQGQHVKDAAHSLEPSGSLAHGGCPHPQHNLLKCQSTLRTTTDDLFSRFATCWYPILKAFQTPGLRFPWPLDTYLLFSQSLSPVFSLAALLCCWALGPLEPPENVQKEAHRSARQHRMCFWGFSFEEQTHGHAGALSSCYVLTGYMTRHD
eukprot:8291308-Pyramimonas_sp.AAC.1